MDNWTRTFMKIRYPWIDLDWNQNKILIRQVTHTTFAYVVHPFSFIISWKWILWIYSEQIYEIPTKTVVRILFLITLTENFLESFWIHHSWLWRKPNLNSINPYLKQQSNFKGPISIFIPEVTPKSTLKVTPEMTVNSDHLFTTASFLGVKS